MAGVICPINIGTEKVGVGQTCPSQGNGAPGGSVGSGERAIVSILVSCFTTSDGVVRRSPDLSSRRIERSVGSMRFLVVPAEVWRMDLSATLGFFTNMRRRALAYFRRRRLRACRMRRRVAILSLLKQSCVACWVVVTMGLRSGRVKIPRLSKSLSGGLGTVRKDSGVLTLD
jgi:hypothetical protein